MQAFEVLKIAVVERIFIVPLDLKRDARAALKRAHVVIQTAE